MLSGTGCALKVLLCLIIIQNLPCNLAAVWIITKLPEFFLLQGATCIESSTLCPQFSICYHCARKVSFINSFTMLEILMNIVLECHGLYNMFPLFSEWITYQEEYISQMQHKGHYSHLMNLFIPTVCEVRHLKLFFLLLSLSNELPLLGYKLHYNIVFFFIIIIPERYIFLTNYWHRFANIYL